MTLHHSLLPLLLSPVLYPSDTTDLPSLHDWSYMTIFTYIKPDQQYSDLPSISDLSFMTVIFYLYHTCLSCTAITFHQYHTSMSDTTVFSRLILHYCTDPTCCIRLMVLHGASAQTSWWRSLCSWAHLTSS